MKEEGRRGNMSLGARYRGGHIRICDRREVRCGSGGSRCSGEEVIYWEERRRRRTQEE
jgi:hypothetical protein